MSYGLRVWDASGGILIDVSDRLSRFHSYHSGTSTYNRVLSVERPTVFVNRATISVPGLVNDGSWFLAGVDVGTAYYRGYYVYFNSGQVVLDIYYSASTSSNITYSFNVMRA